MTPSAEDQIQFLSNLQRLLSEGGFTATYKFAFLLALADLSVELEPGEESVANEQLVALFTSANSCAT